MQAASAGGSNNDGNSDLLAVIFRQLCSSHQQGRYYDSATTTAGSLLPSLLSSSHHQSSLLPHYRMMEEVLERPEVAALLANLVTTRRHYHDGSNLQEISPISATPVVRTPSSLSQQLAPASLLAPATLRMLLQQAQPQPPPSISVPPSAFSLFAKNAALNDRVSLVLRILGYQNEGRSIEAPRPGSATLWPSVPSLLDHHHGPEQNLHHQIQAYNNRMGHSAMMGPCREDSSLPPALSSDPDEQQKQDEEDKQGRQQSFRAGAWTEAEHKLFLKGLAEIGKGKWTEISKMIPTRTAIQTRSHAQKYYNALEKGRSQRFCRTPKGLLKKHTHLKREMK